METLRRWGRAYLKFRRKLDYGALFVVQRIIGTPEFLFLWTGCSVAWMVLNKLGIIKLDPSPFFLMNIVMSEWATFNMPVLTMSDRVISAKADAALAKIEEQNQQIQSLQSQVIAQNKTIIEGQKSQAQLIESHKEMMQVLLFVVRNVDGDVDNMLNILQRQHGE